MPPARAMGRPEFTFNYHIQGSATMNLAVGRQIQFLRRVYLRSAGWGDRRSLQGKERPSLGMGRLRKPPLLRRRRRPAPVTAAWAMACPVVSLAKSRSGAYDGLKESDTVSGGGTRVTQRKNYFIAKGMQSRFAGTIPASRLPHHRHHCLQHLRSRFVLRPPRRR